VENSSLLEKEKLLLKECEKMYVWNECLKEVARWFGNMTWTYELWFEGRLKRLKYGNLTNRKNKFIEEVKILFEK